MSGRQGLSPRWPRSLRLDTRVELELISGPGPAQPTFPHSARKSLDAPSPRDAPARIHGMEHIHRLPSPSPTGPIEPERPPMWRRIGTATLAIGALVAKFAAKLK